MITHWFILFLITIGFGTALAVPWFGAWDWLRPGGDKKGIGGLVCCGLCLIEVCLVLDWLLGTLLPAWR